MILCSWLAPKYIGEDEVYVWESKDRYQKKLILNPQMIQATSILSRWKEAPQENIEVSSLELVANLTESGAGFGIIPSQVVKALKMSLKKIPKTPSFTDKLALVCYPEMIKSTEGKLIFEQLKASYQD